jgi:GntR family transcriptional regulator
MAKTGTGKYEPVVTQLRDQISGGDLAAGDWLPSEAQLMETFGVSRYSAREAIKRLASEGLVVVVDGKGSYVRARAERARHDDPRTLTTTGDGALHDETLDTWQPAEEPVTYRANAGVDLALALGIPEHTPLFARDCVLENTGTGHQARTGHTGGAGGRRMLHRLYLPMATCTRVPALAEDPFVAPDDLYAALHAAGVEFAVTEHVRATAPSPDDAASLHLPAGTPVLITRRVMRDTEGRSLAMEETRRSADDVQLTYAIVPSAPLTPSPAPTARKGRTARRPGAHHPPRTPR